MSIRQRIIDYLLLHPEGTDDDQLAEVLGLKQRQQANRLCRQLESEGLLIRRVVNGKIHNFMVGRDESTPPEVHKKDILAVQPSASNYENWFWEGNVQAIVVRYLVAQNYKICSVANTATKQSGVDIIAKKDGTELWVTVKGYPKGTTHTQPMTQAGHWFKDVIFDIIQYRQGSKQLLLAVALPDYPRFRALAKRITWFQATANFVYFWIQEDGNVKTE